MRSGSKGNYTGHAVTKPPILVAPCESTGNATRDQAVPCVHCGPKPSSVRNNKGRHFGETASVVQLRPHPVSGITPGVLPRCWIHTGSRAICFHSTCGAPPKPNYDCIPDTLFPLHVNHIMLSLDQHACVDEARGQACDRGSRPHVTLDVAYDVRSTTRSEHAFDDVVCSPMHALDTYNLNARREIVCFTNFLSKLLPPPSPSVCFC